MVARQSRLVAFFVALCSAGLGLMLVSSCETRQNTLYLPDGSVERGLQAFQSLGCPSCHVVSEQTIERPYPDPSIYVVLGGQATKVKTYTELVTAIINPSHRLSRGEDPRTVSTQGESKMQLYNEVMTVQQLIDLVEFLKPTYYVWTPETISHEFPDQ